MLTIQGKQRFVCSGLSRRDLLQVGGAGLFGLTLPQVLEAERVAPAFTNGRAKSVMFLFLFGGPSQLETFDMKPDAPSGIRGPFKRIDSRTSGLHVSEHLGRTAQISDKICVIRSMTHPHNDHNACHYVQTGHKWTRTAASGNDVNARRTDWPALGSVVEYLSLQSGQPRQLPDYMYVPNRLGHLQGYDRTGQYAGWLGTAYDGLATDIRKRHKTDNPFFRACNDAELDFQLKGLTEGVKLQRLRGRKRLLDQFDAQRKAADQSRLFESYNRIKQQAANLATSSKIHTALDIRREKPKLRDQYGRHLFGQSTLMGRRLIEAGSRFVTVLWDCPDGYSWDSHVHSKDLEKHLVPGFDQAYSALITDLEQRGLLDETLVVAMGEMGRTPKPNKAWGRGHWSYSFPCALAGAGIRGGTVYGKSDKVAAYPVEKPVSPEDIAATIFWALGIDHEVRLPDAQGRPVQIIDGGRPLTELFG